MVGGMDGELAGTWVVWTPENVLPSLLFAPSTP